jgi:pyrroloquinoline quinone biosynthesis protein B
MDKRAADMAHLPIGGPDGSLARLADLAVARKLFVHINNTNPILREDSAERERVEAAGWTVAEDGMEIAL